MVKNPFFTAQFSIFATIEKIQLVTKMRIFLRKGLEILS